MEQNTDWTNAALWASSLSEQEKEIRRQFVKEYLLDYNPFNAALRCGFNAEVANEYGHRFLQCGYVQELIAQKVKITPDEKDRSNDLDVKKRMVEEMLLKVATTGTNETAVVNALKQLSSIYGLDKAPIADEHAIKGGVMVVPLLPAEKWEDYAKSQQAKLQEDSIKNDVDNTE